MDKAKKGFTPPERMVFAVGMLLLALSIAMHFVSAFRGDKIWLLFAVGKMLDGGRLYQDIVEVNPPLIYGIFCIPAYLSRHIGLLRDYQYLVLLGLAAIGASLYLSLKFLRLHPAFAQDGRKQAQFCLLFASVLITFTNPVYFLDREHWFLLLSLPYIFRFMPYAAEGAVSMPLRVLTGVMAGIGFSIKPHCLLVFAGLQLVSMVRERSMKIAWSVESVMAYAFIAGYVIAVFALTPDYARTIIPIALETYSATHRREAGMFFALIALLTFAATFVEFRPRQRSPHVGILYYLAAAGLPFLGYALLNNGWGYTWNPLTSLMELNAGFMLWHFLYLRDNNSSGSGEEQKRYRFGQRACMIVFAANLLIAMVNFYVQADSCEGYFQCDEGKEFLTRLTAMNDGKPPVTFGAVGMDFYIWAYFSRETGARWETRFNHLWMLPKFFTSGPDFTARHQWILDYVTQAYAHDLDTRRPEIVFVEDTDNFFAYRQPVDLVAYLSRSRVFGEAWRHYVLMGTVRNPGVGRKKEHNGFFVYRRMD